MLTTRAQGEGGVVITCDPLVKATEPFVVGTKHGYVDQWHRAEYYHESHPIGHRACEFDKHFCRLHGCYDI